MITVFTKDGRNPRVQIGTHSSEIAEDKENGIEHRSVPIETGLMSVKFLEALNDLSPDAAQDIEDLLTNIYDMGVEDGKKYGAN